MAGPESLSDAVGAYLANEWMTAGGEWIGGLQVRMISFGSSEGFVL